MTDPRAVEPPNRIEGGIEFFTVTRDDGPPEEDTQCARCGSSVTFVSCWQCGGEGARGSACIDDLCHGEEECIHGDDAQIVCDICRGKGSFGHCISPPEWCEAHPMPGREQIESTAMPAEAWRDYD